MIAGAADQPPRLYAGAEAAAAAPPPPRRLPPTRSPPPPLRSPPPRPPPSPPPPPPLVRNKFLPEGRGFDWSLAGYMDSLAPIPSVSNNVQNVRRPPFNAMGDGVTDDTKAILVGCQRRCMGHAALQCTAAAGRRRVWGTVGCCACELAAAAPRRGQLCCRSGPHPPAALRMHLQAAVAAAAGDRRGSGGVVFFPAGGLGAVVGWGDQVQVQAYEGEGRFELPCWQALEPSGAQPLLPRHMQAVFRPGARCTVHCRHPTRCARLWVGGAVHATPAGGDIRQPASLPTQAPTCCASLWRSGGLAWCSEGKARAGRSFASLCRSVTCTPAPGASSATVRGEGRSSSTPVDHSTR